MGSFTKIACQMKAIFFEISQQDKKSTDLSVPGFQG
jgi:hypothetical protein